MEGNGKHLKIACSFSRNIDHQNCHEEYNKVLCLFNNIKNNKFTRSFKFQME